MVEIGKGRIESFADLLALESSGCCVKDELRDRAGDFDRTRLSLPFGSRAKK